MTAAAPETAPERTNALDVANVDVAYRVRGKDRSVLRDVSFQIRKGESYGLVGESGSGKSTMALALMRYLPRNGRVRSGAITIDGRDALALGGTDLRRLRAETVSMVYQEPGRALNPSLRVGRQVAEVYEIAGLDRATAMERSEAILNTVRISDPAGVMRRYPHQLSGGMLQRVVIAMALASEPALLVLDEPTTALDATVEAEVLDLVAALRDEFSTSVLFISHNLGVIARMCDRVGVLYAGELVEEGTAAEVFEGPRHPYTVGLLRCIPRRGRRKDHGRLDTIPGFLPQPGQTAEGCIFAPRCALADDRCRTESPPAYDVGPGRTSRCHHHEQRPRAAARDAGRPAGAGRARGGGAGGEPARRVEDVHVLRRAPARPRRRRPRHPPRRDARPRRRVGQRQDHPCPRPARPDRARPGVGRSSSRGEAVAGDARERTREQVKALQIVFQNPDSALNRRHSVRRLVGRALHRLAGLDGDALQARLLELIRSVRMEERHLALRPTQLSGGLKQRVAIARAFAGNPEVVVCDEPTSALDVSVQAAILNLLVDLQSREGVTYLFISHDLGVVRYLSDRIAVLYLGRIMELGTAETVFAGPHHPYTEALLSAVPSLDGTHRERIRLEGEIPSAADPPTGCVFHTRCPRKLGAVCETTEPPLEEAEDRPPDALPHPARGTAQAPGR